MGILKALKTEGSKIEKQLVAVQHARLRSMEARILFHRTRGKLARKSCPPLVERP